MAHSTKDTRSDTRDARLKRLATGIEKLAEKDALSMRQARDILALRRSAAKALFTICSDFVTAVNRFLPQAELMLDPAEYTEHSFHADAPNLLQINVRGRILQVEFEATPELVSTEDFRVPYTLAGSIRAFNQALLEKDRIEEQLIFYTLEKGHSMWRFFDARTYRSGPLDEEYLISLMEQLI